MEPSQESKATKKLLSDIKKSNKPIVIFLHFLDSVLLPSHRKFGKGFWSMELGKSPFIHTDRSTVFTVHERIEVPSRNTQQSRLGVKIQNLKMALTLKALSFGLRLNIFAYVIVLLLILCIEKLSLIKNPIYFHYQYTLPPVLVN